MFLPAEEDDGVWTPAGAGSGAAPFPCPLVRPLMAASLKCGTDLAPFGVHRRAVGLVDQARHLAAVDDLVVEQAPGRWR